MSAPLVINILMISGSLLLAAICNAVQPSCINKTKKQYIFNEHYKDKFQLNVLLTHNTFIIFKISLKHPLCYIVDMLQLLYGYVHVYITTKYTLD